MLNFAELVATSVVANAKRTDNGKSLPLRCSPFGGKATASGSLGERGGTFVGRAGHRVGSAAESAEFTVCFASNTTGRWGVAPQTLKLRVRMQERADDAERHEAVAETMRVPGPATGAGEEPELAAGSDASRSERDLGHLL